MLDNIQESLHAKDKFAGKVRLGGVKKASYVTNEYYDNIKQWYAFKYFQPYAYFVYILIFCIMVVPFAKIATDLLFEQYEPIIIPYPIYFDDEVKYFAAISSIAQKDENMNVSIARYLTEQYVKVRENYSSGLLKQEAWVEMLNKIKMLSSRQVFAQFIKYIDTQENPDSPILKYRTTAERIIEIQSIKFNNYDSIPNLASVIFKASVKKNNKTTVTYYKADLNFDMSDMYIVQAQNMPMFFRVMSYNTYEITDSNNQ